MLGSPYVPLLLAEEAAQPTLPDSPLPCHCPLLWPASLLLWIQLHQIQNNLHLHSKRHSLLLPRCFLLHECDGLRSLSNVLQFCSNESQPQQVFPNTSTESNICTGSSCIVITLGGFLLFLWCLPTSLTTWKGGSCFFPLLLLVLALPSWPTTSPATAAPFAGSTTRRAWPSSLPFRLAQSSLKTLFFSYLLSLASTCSSGPPGRFFGKYFHHLMRSFVSGKCWTPIIRVDEEG